MIGNFTKNTLITLFTQTFLFVLGLGISIMIARVLGPEGKGIYSLALVFSTFLIAFSSLGIGPASVFHVGKRAFSLKDIFGNNVILAVFLSAIVIFSGLLIVFFFHDLLFPDVKREYLLLALALIPLNLFFNFAIYIILGLQNIKTYNGIYVFKNLLSIVFIGVALLVFRLGVSGAIIAEVLSFLGVSVLLFFLVRKEADGISFKFNKDYIKKTFSYGSKIYLAYIFSLLHYKVDILLIGILLNPAMVGIYTISCGLSERLYAVSDAAGMVLFPKVASEPDEKKLKEFTPLVFRTSLLITAVLSLLLFVIGPWLIVLLYSDVFLDSIKPFQILLIAAVALSGFRILEMDLRGRGKPIYIAYIAAFSFVLNILLNILLIPNFGIVGAAWATVISYTFSFLVLIVIYAKVSDNKITDIIFVKKSDIILYKGLFSLKGRFKD